MVVVHPLPVFRVHELQEFGPDQFMPWQFSQALDGGVGKHQQTILQHRNPFHRIVHHQPVLGFRAVQLLFQLVPTRDVHCHPHRTTVGLIGAHHAPREPDPDLRTIGPPHPAFAFKATLGSFRQQGTVEHTRIIAGFDEILLQGMADGSSGIEAKNRRKRLI